jgi:hypothetical protein
MPSYIILMNRLIAAIVEPMSDSFEIVLSRPLAPADLVAALVELLPTGLRVDVAEDISGLPSDPGAILACVRYTGDPDWPCVFECFADRKECGLGPYPDLRIAERLWQRFATNSLCCIYPFAGDLDPHDPYWSLACIEGRWYLASTLGTRLMGPYDGGIAEFPGGAKIRIIRRVTVPAMEIT